MAPRFTPRLPSGMVILPMLLLLLTPHMAVVRGQILDLAGGGGIKALADNNGTFAAADLRTQLDTALGTLDGEMAQAVIDSFGTGENLAKLKEAVDMIRGLTDMSTLSDAQGRFQDAVTLLLDAEAATSGALIALVALGLGFAAAVTSTVAGALYAAASAVGLAATLATVESNCAAAAAADGVRTNNDNNSNTNNNNKNDKNDKKDQPQCKDDKQDKNNDWIDDIAILGKEANKYVVPWVFDSSSDQSLQLAEGLLTYIIDTAKKAQPQKKK